MSDEMETGWVQLPTEIKERALDLRRKIRALNGDIDRAVVAGLLNADSGRYAAWKGFVNGYGRWLHEVSEGHAPDWVKWGWSDVAATIEVKAAELRDWFAWYARLVGPPSVPAPPKRTDPIPGLTPSVPPWVWAGIGVAGAFGLAKLLGSIRK